MNRWRHQVQRQSAPMVEVPLAATYLAARLLGEAADGELLQSALLQHLRKALSECAHGSNFVLKLVEDARHAALPLDRNELDSLFAAAALAGGDVKDYAFHCEDMPLGLGYFDLTRGTYVATLADCYVKELDQLRPFLPPDGFDQLRSPWLALERRPCGLLAHDESPSLFALHFSEDWLAVLQPALDLALAESDGLKLECQVLLPANPHTNGGIAWKAHSTKTLALQRLPSGALALAHARPEWLLEIHALSMQEAWVHLECSCFRMLCRLPDISEPASTTCATGFLPRGWLTQTLGIPESCNAYLPPLLVARLAERFPWLAATAPYFWLACVAPAVSVASR